MNNWYYNMFGTPSSVEEDKDKYVIVINALGIAKEDTKVEVSDGMLKISGESNYTQLREKYRLPSGVDLEGITAESKDGILTVIIPKSDQARGKLIEVK